MWIRVINFHIQLAEGSEDSPREDPESQVIIKSWKDKAQCFLLSLKFQHPNPTPSSCPETINSCLEQRNGGTETLQPIQYWPSKKSRSKQLGLLFPTNLMLLCYHVAILDFLDLSSLFTIPSHLLCQHLAMETKALQRTCKKPGENREQVHMVRCHSNKELAHVQNCGADSAPEYRGNSQPKCRRLPLVQGQRTISRAGGTAGEDKVNGGKDFLSPRCPQEPLDQRH